MHLTVYEILILCGVPSILSFLFTWWFNKKKGKKNVDYELRKAIQADLRLDLLFYHDKFKPQGWIPVEYKSAYDNMYKRYHALGKNGVMDGYHKEIMELPTSPIKNS